MSTVAFIGLGNMGLPMAINLLHKGFNVRAFDLVADAVAAIAAKGATACHSAVDAATGADVVVSMLPAGKHTRALYLGDSDSEGLLQTVAEDTLLIDCSTIDAATAKEVSLSAEDKGFDFVDAPVSGGTAGATAGTLTFICGGNVAAVERAKPILSAMGCNIFHAGGPGSGQLAKICNNMLLSVLMVGTSEALSMGIDNGLDPKVLSDIMKVSSGGNWALEKYNPCPGVMPEVPASKGYQGGFMVDLMVKDLGLSQETALKSLSSTPMGALARALFVAHARNGNGRRDFSSIFEQFCNKKA
ncbi:3-hydroxyisobutyrate dehydrogenase [Shewanella sp. 4t3-1-2LB]|uniref:3-hydroxyisobutyrate dehydrogenase n=1 Tax=Shewanella sp. 4t3-1-2LB TaxID=2817682 RepID=UPI001A998E36|nr:3-hydroxyisobutyrate dehydrogenase [Shewanella sp. 4t3-1-2LB]MBO1272966.1 3-hydroxyisobutyrate dehydrogenase [Shewanella sp. 4t3-1-2LB]